MVLPDNSILIALTTDILNTMFRLCKHLSLYREDNSVVTQTTDQLLQKIRQVPASGDGIQIAVSKHGFLFQGEYLSKKNLLFTTFAHRMFQLGLSSFTLTSELTVPSLYAFLRVIMRNATEVWDEGGVGASLQDEHIVGIQFTEMSESDFRLLNTTDDEEQIERLQQSSDPWGKFSRSLSKAMSIQGLETSGDEELTPAELATRISNLLVGKNMEEQGALIRQLTHFAASMQREKLKSERISAVLNLADFVNHLSDDLRSNVMSRICNLQMTQEYAEDFFNGLSDNVILDTFQQTTTQPGYSSPVVMSLISKLASTRKLVSDAELSVKLNSQQEMSDKIKELLKPDEFKKYVPSRYQQVLMQVLSSQNLPSATNDKLQELKKSLEDFQQERQVVRLSLAILNDTPEENSLAGLRERLLGALQASLDVADYSHLVDLCRLCFTDKASRAAIYLAGLIPVSFVEQVLGCVPSLSKDDQEEIAEVIGLIGLPFVRPMIESSISESDRSIRFFYLGCLKKLGHQVAEFAVQSLNDEQWFVQRNMLILLGELGAVEKLPQIRPLLKHGNLKVRQEALKTCLLLHDADSTQELIYSLFSKNRQEVLHAITLSHLVDDPKLSAKLLNMLQKKEVFRLDFDMKKALVQALADHQCPQALKVFSQILKSHKIFSASLHRRLQVEIVKSLGKYQTEQVSTLLQKQIDRGTKVVANQAKLTLKKLSQENL